MSGVGSGELSTHPTPEALEPIYHMAINRRLHAACAYASLALGACQDIESGIAGDGDRRAAPKVSSRTVTPANHVDTIVPVEEALRRFRSDLSPVTGLVGGEATKEALVRRFVHAIETRDTASFRQMVLSRSEFAYLYYPFTRHTRKPYTQDPALVWFLIQMNSEKGITRALRYYGGKSLGYVKTKCEKSPRREGLNRLWTECLVHRVAARGDTLAEHMFGGILELDGHHKFIGYANKF